MLLSWKVLDAAQKDGKGEKDASTALYFSGSRREFVRTYALEMLDPGIADDPGAYCFRATLPDRGEGHPRRIYFSGTHAQVRGGTFDTRNLALLAQGIQEATREPDAVFVFTLNTGGARITHSRTMFDPLWELIPLLFALRKKALLITLAEGKCLGAGAIYFGQGRIRIATGEATPINLTGPSILKSFFGGSSENFAEYASVGHQLETNQLIHEAYATETETTARLRELLDFIGFGSGSPTGSALSPPAVIPRQAPAHPPTRSSEKSLTDLLFSLGEESLEVFTGMSPVFRTFLVRNRGRILGVIAQPPRFPYNIIDLASVRRFQSALRLFASLKVPVLSCIDSPGGDPRMSESDRDIVMATIDLNEQLVEYPFPKMGLIVCRCFGGSGMFSFPRGYGGLGLYALEDAKMGVMSNSIIDKMVAEKPGASREWEVTLRSHDHGLADLIREGTIREVISQDQIRDRIEVLFPGNPGA